MPLEFVNEEVLLTKRVSIINFKGGVGKTTVAFHLATGLARYHDSRVLLVDVDHQSSLSLVCLTDGQWKQASKERKTINSVFLHFTQRGVPLPGREIILEEPLDNYPNLDLVPSELQLDETELDLSGGAGDPVQSEWDKRMLIAKWIQENNVDENYDYVIFDCPPATKIVTQNAIAVSHGYIIPAIPDSVSSRGIPHLIDRMFAKIDEKLSGLAKYLRSEGSKTESTYVPGTETLGIIVFRIRTHGPAYSGYVAEHTTYERVLKRMYGKLIIEPYIEEGVGVLESMSERKPVYDCSYNPNVTNRNFIKVFKDITAECRKRIDAI